jgi:hypothetical protein
MHEGASVFGAEEFIVFLKQGVISSPLCNLLNTEVTH